VDPSKPTDISWGIVISDSRMKYINRTIKLREVVDTQCHFCIRVKVLEEELSKRQGESWFTNVGGKIFKSARIFIFCDKIRVGRE
jgi:hypothetical protein